MKKRDIEAVIGIPFAMLRAFTPLHVFVYVGKSVENLGTARTVTRALEVIHSKALYYGLIALSTGLKACRADHRVQERRLRPDVLAPLR